jgi:hypothetical protein
MDIIRPTRARILAVIAVTVAGFCLPQDVPLEYYPLNEPSAGTLYVEIVCEANVAGMVRLSLDTGRLFKDVDAIRWPVNPGGPCTYTFPLPDAPIRRMRLAPFETSAGELTVLSFRIIDREGRELRRFSIHNFQRSFQIAAIVPAGRGWRLVTNANATSPFSEIELHQALVPHGMNARNAKRCLLSWTYLTFMLGLMLLAVQAALRPGDSLFGKGPPPRSALRSALYLVLVAALFSAIANRGLIRDTARYAFHAPWAGSF